MSDDIKEIRHEVVLKNNCSNELESDIPQYVVLSMNEGVLAEMLKGKQAYEAAAAYYPSGANIYGLEVSFFGFDYREEDYDAEEREDGFPGLKAWEGGSECLALVVDDQGYRLKALIKNSDSEMTSVYLTYREFEEHLRQFRSKQMAGGIEQAMPEDDAPASRKSSGMSPI